MADSKIEQYVKINQQIKELKLYMESLGKEIIDEITDKVSVGTFTLAKREKFVYTLKPDMDVKQIAEIYPATVEIKINAKNLYKICDEPEQYVKKSITSYLEVRNSKEDVTEIDF